MKRLCRRLRIPTWQAVGLLESTWHVTARETPAGNIGKLSNEDIALAIDYDADESELISALVETGWVDADDNHRLVIHDWSHHADDATHMKLARARQFFADGQPPKLTRLAGIERKAAEEFYNSCAQNGDPCAQEQKLESAPVNPCAQHPDPCAQNDDPCALPEPRQSLAPPEPEPSRGLAPPEPHATTTSSSANRVCLHANGNDDDAASTFAASVKKRWEELDMVCGRWTHANEQLAREEFRRGTPIEVMQAAMLWGTWMRFKAMVNNASNEKILSLKYYINSLENEQFKGTSRQQLAEMDIRLKKEFLSRRSAIGPAREGAA